MLGFAGEGIENSKKSDLCWISHSHFPIHLMNDPKQYCNKAICLIRHPRDCLLSFFNFFITTTNEKSVNLEVVYDKYHDVFKNFMKISF
jgi:hypothetical protein